MALLRNPFVFCFVLFAEDVLTTQASSKPNILFIVVDDLRPSLGCYGNDVMVTPNVDNLASKSVLFTRAYVQQAFCGPSRASFLTSRRPDTTRVYDLHHYWRTIGGNYTTLPQHFKENGYFTASVGKIFHPGTCSGGDDDFKYSWSVPAYHPSTQKYKPAKVCPGPDGKKYMNVVCPVNVTLQPEGTLPDIQSTRYAVEFLRNVSKQKVKEPFFLGVGYHKPHIPLKYPKQYLDLYPVEEIHIAKDHTIPSRLPLVAWNPWTDIRLRDDVKRLNVSFPYGPVPKDFQRLMIQSYYAATTYTDDLLGHLVSTLDELGLANNTIISFVGDHGWSLGEHQEWSKYSNFEVAVRVPLMFYIPGMTASKVPAGQMFPYHNPFRDDTTIEIEFLHHAKGNRNSKEASSGVFYHTSNDKEMKPGKDGQFCSAKECASHRNLRSDSLVELVDIFPTLSEFAGLMIPPLCPESSFNTLFCTEGSSLGPVIRNLTSKSAKNDFHWKNASFSQYPRPSDTPQNNSDKPLLHDIKIMGYSMRTDKYRYTEWIEFNPFTFTANWSNVYAKELYLHDIDEDEDENMAGNPQYNHLVKKLSAILRAGWRNALPNFSVNKSNGSDEEQSKKSGKTSGCNIIHSAFTLSCFSILFAFFA